MSVSLLKGVRKSLDSRVECVGRFSSILDKKKLIGQNNVMSTSCFRGPPTTHKTSNLRGWCSNWQYLREQKTIHTPGLRWECLSWLLWWCADCSGCRKRSTAKGVRSLFFRVWTLSVTFSDASVTFFGHFFARLLLPDSFCGRVNCGAHCLSFRLFGVSGVFCLARLLCRSNFYVHFKTSICLL